MIKHTLRLRTHADMNVYGVDAWRSDKQVIVVLHELPENKNGVSVTNAVEAVATDVVRGLKEHGVVADPAKVVWIEHYPQRDTLGYGSGSQAADQATWDEVLMTWDASAERYQSPAWRPFNGDRYAEPMFGAYARLL